MFTLPTLPYADTALAPVISTNTLGFHYGKNHKIANWRSINMRRNSIGL